MSFFRLSELRTSARAHRTTSGFLEGLRYVWRKPDLRAILIMLFLIGTFGLNFPIFISTMAVNVFHSDARGFGLLSSIMAVGTLSGALFAASRQKPGLASLLVGAGVFGLGCTLAALAPGYWWFGTALMILGAAGVIFTNGTNSIMQLSTEPAMRGRAMALRVGIALGGTPIGAPIVGWVANHFGPRWALGIGAGAGFTAPSSQSAFSPAKRSLYSLSTSILRILLGGSNYQSRGTPKKPAPATSLCTLPSADQTLSSPKSSKRLIYKKL